ncbi:Cytochrome c1 heme lyase [Cryptotrichosporon argae]
MTLGSCAPSPTDTCTRHPPSCASAKLSSVVDILFTPLLLGRAIITSFLNPFRRAQAEAASGQIAVQVKWGRDRFNIPIPSPSTTPLSTLLATLSTQTSIPAEQLKLIHKGAVLKDASLTLSAYGIADGATLVLVGKSGDAPGPAAARGPAPAPPAAAKKNRPPETDKESVLVDWLRSFAAALLDPLQPAIATFVSHASPSATNRPAQTPAFDVLQKEHARLSDTLIKGLLDLDGVTVPSGWTVARQARKDAVKRVQADMNRVDEAWGERKRLT